MKSIELKIKIKSLVAEIGIIRAEEAKLIKSIRYFRGQGEETKIESLNSTLQSIQFHRRVKIRHTLRYAGLCRAFMRNQPYKLIESKTRPGNEVSPGALIAEINRFVGKHIKTEDVDRWLTEEHQQRAAA